MSPRKRRNIPSPFYGPIDDESPPNTPRTRRTSTLQRRGEETPVKRQRGTPMNGGTPTPSKRDKEESTPKRPRRSTVANQVETPDSVRRSSRPSIPPTPITSFATFLTPKRAPSETKTLVKKSKAQEEMEELSPVVEKSPLSSQVSQDSESGTIWRFNSIGVPECPLPCRQSQFEEIWTFVHENVSLQNSRCLYVSGVPGTGKTLIVEAVVDCLSRYAKEKKPHLKFHNVYINGLSLGSPEKIWKRLAMQIPKLHEKFKNNKSKLNPNVALKALNGFFETKGRLPVVLVIDELDQLLDRKQSILYQLLEWAGNPSNMFSLIAIFNTMNLPENILVMRNVSRMGFMRCIFPPYTHEQLQTIIKSSLEECKSEKIKDDAIELLSKKVAAVSGDARRALEIARRAIEVVETGQVSGIMGVNAAFKEIFSSIKIETMKYCSLLEQSVLKHLTKELESTGTDETTLFNVLDSLTCASAYEGHKWSKNQFLGAITKLFMMKLIILENNSPSIHKKVSLNVPFEDVHFALNVKNTE